MSVVQLLGVNVTNNPARFSDKYVFEITFECVEQLEKDLEWKLTYVGSAQSNNYDQELDSLLVGPIPVGVNKFVFEADAPDLTRIPTDELLGVTVILLTCAYDGREFVRVGYYVNNEYDDETLVNDPPAKPVIEKIRRNVLAEKPRVTRFAIKWDSEATAPPEFPPEQPEADLAAPDEDAYAADELAEEEAAEAEAETEGVAKKEGEDDAMGGLDGADAATKLGAETGANAEEDDMSEDGSVDLADSEEEQLEEEEEEEVEAEAEAGHGEAMEVDKPAAAAAAAAAAATNPAEVTAH